MAEISEAHILECYEAYRHGKACPYPKGMNERSANMTMVWLDAIWNDRRWKISFSAMQCGVVLARIKVDYGIDKARKVALSIKRDLDLQTETYGTPKKAHRQVIKAFLMD